MTALGAVFVPMLPPERLRPIVRAADEAGLDELWLWEDCFFESGIATAAAALAYSERLVVGVGLLPVPLRNVAITAMELATLHRLFPGRVRVGVGHGVQDWMGQVGARVESPLTLLREQLDALRALLRGEEVTCHGRYVQLDKVKLRWAPTEPVAVLAGATGPRTLRLSGAAADGTILTGGTTTETLRAARAQIDAGRAEAGRTDPHPITVYLHSATGPDAAARMETERFEWRYDTMAGRSAVGDAAEVAAAAGQWARAGADAVILQPTPDDPDPEGFMRFTAEQVKPLLTP
ncbi:LLM class flavin-dependent oxidoreductase [Catellatospora tritici]|uniref:LLM class flavin-dependent oxidoreductase n=1 Tax=Catellatospora tritici TaxID=2851566 RepID=UPI0027E14BA5|nr:LLM class flavin-dependent oxidoreductase [Catellatospora tritici]